MKSTTADWLKAANDDLLVVSTIIPNADLTHIVAFHAQQTIEKSLKAVLEEKMGSVPRIHNLGRLVLLVNPFIAIADDDILMDLDSLYCDSRYPSNLGLMPHGYPSLADANAFFDYAHKVYNQVISTLR